MSKLSRRGFLRGSLQGAAVGMALPFLNCFLSESGKAMAATGQRIPVRFGSWIWGCGFIPELWVPEQTGSGYTMPAHLKPVEKYRDKLTLLSGFDVKLDGVPNKPHITGCFGLRTGIPVPDRQVKALSLIHI